MRDFVLYSVSSDILSHTDQTTVSLHSFRPAQSNIYNDGLAERQEVERGLSSLDTREYNEVCTSN